MRHMNDEKIEKEIRKIMRKEIERKIEEKHEIERKPGFTEFILDAIRTYVTEIVALSINEAKEEFYRKLEQDAKELIAKEITKMLENVRKDIASQMRVLLEKLSNEILKTLQIQIQSILETIIREKISKINISDIIYEAVHDAMILLEEKKKTKSP